MPGIPEFVPTVAFVFYWALVGIAICPPWPPWPRPPIPGPWPPPPPPWMSLVGVVAAIAAGWLFTGLAGVGTSPSSPILELAATGAFAAAGAFLVRNVLAPLASGAPAGAGSMRAGTPTHAGPA